MGKKSIPSWKHRGEAVFVETSQGALVQCLPIAELMQMVKADTELPDEPTPPTWTLEGVGGATEKRAYTEKSIQRQDVSEEDKSAWEEYQNELVLYQAKQTQRAREIGTKQIRVMALRGTRVEEGKSEEEWIEEMEWMRFTIPDDERDRTLQYFKSEICATPEDAQIITLGIAKASGAEPGALQKMEDSFRLAVEQSKREDPKGVQGGNGIEAAAEGEG